MPKLNLTNSQSCDIYGAEKREMNKRRFETVQSSLRALFPGEIGIST